jgi:hypothetical protein
MIDKEKILIAVHQIENWKGHSYETGDEVHQALMNIKEAIGLDVELERKKAKRYVEIKYGAL